MDIGYFTMPMHPPGSNMTLTLEDDLEQIVALDKLGYREAWIGEHFTTAWENIPAPDLFIAQALPLTENIVLGTGVTCMPNHNPFVIAHRVAQLDHMAKGRFHWGVGSGGFPGDFDVFGFVPATGEHRGMTREAVDLVLQLWDDPKPGLYESKYWRFTVPEPQEDIALRFHVKPYQQPHPPIGMAGVSEKSDTLTLAGARGYIPMSINLAHQRILKTHWDGVETGAAETGRPADRSTWRIAREVYVGENSKKARREAIDGVLGRDFTDYFRRLLPKLRGLNGLKSDPDMPDSEIDAEYMADNVWLVGGPDEVAEKLSELYEYVGGFGVLLVMGHEWQPEEQWRASMEMLVNEVLPKVNA